MAVQAVDGTIRRLHALRTRRSFWEGPRLLVGAVVALVALPPRVRTQREIDFEPPSTMAVMKDVHLGPHWPMQPRSHEARKPLISRPAPSR